MSILFFEGFETSGDSVGFANRADNIDNFAPRWDDFQKSGLDSDWPFLIDDAFSEGYALQMGQNSFSNANHLTWDVPASLHVPAGASAPTMVVGYRLYVPTTARTFVTLQINGQFVLDSNHRQLSLNVKDSTDLTLNLGTFGDFHTIADVLIPGEWHYIEMRFKNAESADGGLIQVWVDEILQIDLDPVDANNAMTVSATSQIVFQTTNASTGTDYVGYDDIYILHEDGVNHTSRLGKTRVRSLPPNGDELKAWKNNAGSGDNFDKVDENGLNTSTYVETDVQGERERFRLTDTTEDEAIFSLKVEADAINTQGGDPSLTLELKSGSTLDTEEVTVDDIVNYNVFDKYYEQNPDTSADWVNTEVDSLQAGFSFDNKVS